MNRIAPLGRATSAATTAGPGPNAGGPGLRRTRPSAPDEESARWKPPRGSAGGVHAGTRRVRQQEVGLRPAPSGLHAPGRPIRHPQFQHVSGCWVPWITLCRIRSDMSRMMVTEITAGGSAPAPADAQHALRPRRSRAPSHLGRGPSGRSERTRAPAPMVRAGGVWPFAPGPDR